VSDLSSKLRAIVSQMRDGALMPCGAVYQQILDAADEIERLHTLFGGRFHLDATCGSCGGPLECDRDAICHRCTDKMEIERLRTELDEAGHAINRHLELLVESRQETVRLETIVDPLPKTANGAIIVLGKTELWARDDYSDPPLVFRLGVAISLSVGVAMGPPKVMADSSSFVDCDQTYSTREVAEKARG